MNAIHKIILALITSLSLLTGPVQAACNANLPEATPTADFTFPLIPDGTVTHNKTGLMWMRCTLGLSGADCAAGAVTPLNWTAALTAANDSMFAGFDDWRLPNIKELASIVETQCTSPSINPTVFPATPSSFFWSAFGDAGFSVSAWNLCFFNGNDDGDGKNFVLHVRLVRGGQLFDSFDDTLPTSTTTIISDNPDPSAVGQAVTVNVMVTAPATGTVTVMASTGESCTVTLNNSAGSCQIIFTTVGARTLAASYAGDANFNPSVSAQEEHTVLLIPGAAGPTAIPTLNLWGLGSLVLLLAGLLGWRWWRVS